MDLSTAHVTQAADLNARARLHGRWYPEYVLRSVPTTDALLCANAVAVPLVFKITLQKNHSPVPHLVAVLITPSLHPRTAQRLHDIGVKNLRGTVINSNLAELLYALPGAPVFDKVNGKLQRLSRTALVPGYTRVTQSAAARTAQGVKIVLDRSSSKTKVVIVIENVALESWRLSPLTPLVIAIPALASLLERNREMLFEDATSGDLSKAWARCKSALIVTNAPGAPGAALVREGLGRQWFTTCRAAMSYLAENEEGSYVFCEPDVADTALLEEEPTPVLEDALRPAQRDVVERFKLSAKGLVCALAPGSGKTVATAVLLQETSCSSAVIVAVPALHDQWAEALARFAPSLLLTRPKGEQVKDAYLSFKGVLLLSPRQVASVTQTTQTHDVLVIDEAHTLLAGPKTKASLEILRTRSKKTLLLTGTPAFKGVKSLGSMVEFVLNKRCFLNYPLEAEHALSWEARVGPLLQSGAGHPVELPNMSRKIVAISPTSDDAKALLVSSENFTTARTLLDNASDFKAARDARLAVSRASSQLTAVTAHPGLVLDQPVVGAKASYIADLLQDGKPTVVCLHSAKAARLIKHDLAAAGISSSVLDASVPPSERAAVVKELGLSVQVLILPENSSTGTDVPQASRLIHADTPTSAAQELQRSSRACRLNSVSDVTEIIYLVLSGFPEESTAQQFVDIDV